MMNLIRPSLLLGLALALTTSSFAQVQEVSPTEKFATLLYYIENMYVDSVNQDQLVDAAIQGMLDQLDPHSVYVPPERLEATHEPLNGSFDGIGIQFQIVRDTILVVSPIGGGPSEALGILPGDKIVEVEGESVASIGITNRRVAELLKGPKGTRVNVGIHRKGEKELIHFEITRDKIPIYSVDAHFMMDEKVGYVKVNRFSHTTIAELREAMGALKKQGMKDLILDLQGNGGGLLRAAVEMADEFLSEDKLIVYMEGEHLSRDDRMARRPGMHEKGNLVVLIDESSASASEIVSGAIQDWDRGLIVGRRSFGKGLVQRPLPLPDGSEVRLTVQNYYTPSGRCIQKSYADGVEAYRSEKYERYESGEMYNMDELDLPDSLRFETKIKNRPVYGGGGILPDVFVPLDTAYRSEMFTNILRKGLCSRFVLDHLENNREELMRTYTNADAFLANFEVDSKLEKAFIEHLKKEDVEFNQADYDTSKAAIHLRLKAFTGRNLYDQNMFYRVIVDLNPACQKAWEVLRDGSIKKMNLAHSQF